MAGTLKFNPFRSALLPQPIQLQKLPQWRSTLFHKAILHVRWSILNGLAACIYLQKTSSVFGLRRPVCNYYEIHAITAQKS